MKPLALMAIAPLAVAAFASDDWRDWRYQDRQTVQRSFKVSGSAKLEVDNVSGFVHVTGYDGNTVEIEARKEARADTAEDLERSKREVTLEIAQLSDVVRVYVDGPFRNHDNGGRRWYHVNYDYEIKVPRATVVDLRTVNNGDIEVKGTTGDFKVNGLNGGIDMDAVSGSGSVRTLNGKVRVAFAQNPKRDCEFHTLNGGMDVYFQSPLNADLHFKTLNGGVYADFDVAPIPTSVSGQLQGGKYLYRTGRESSGRAGAGGPTLRFDGLNGAIRLHTKSL